MTNNSEKTIDNTICSTSNTSTAGRHKLLWFFIVINLLLVMGLSVANYYIYMSILDNNNNYNNLTKKSKLVNSNIDNIKTNSQAISNSIINLENSISDNQDKIENINKSVIELAAINKDPSQQLKVLTVENLVNAADTKLKAENDINTAKEILNSAQLYLNNTKQPQLKELRKNILVKIKQLDDITQPDLINIAATLEETGSEVDTVTVADLFFNNQQIKGYKSEVQLLNNLPDSQNGKLNNQDTIEKENKYQKAFNSFKADILNLVKIRTIDNNSDRLVQLLDDQQLNNLKLYYKLKFAEASISLRQYNSQEFNMVIDELIVTTNKYFTNNTELKQRILTSLNASKQVELNPVLPSLDDLYTEIKKVSNS